MDDSVSEDLEEVEKDPTGRYVRYSEILGEGAFKIVYKAFDEDNGIEVAWNKVQLSEDILKSDKQLERLYAEADLLKSLNHENVLRCYHSWVDNENKTINMITEMLTSGNLRQYRKKHNGLGVSNNKKAIKSWARQILKGLDYLHSHEPPIIHRDLKCENLFVNGNSGKVKIGDLGLATVLEHATACSVTGTPEFMAPELYEEEYNQLVDVYSFGMCMLQMITNEKPYSECSNTAQIYRKVTAGIKPVVLNKVTDPQLRHFIEKCLAPVSERLSAAELLKDPFLILMIGDFSIPRCCSLFPDSVCLSMSVPAVAVKVEQKVIVSEKCIFKLQGEMVEGNDSVSMTLWIRDLGGNADKADFLFFLETDTNVSVAGEMEKDLGLSRNDASLIADLIEEVIADIVPAKYYYKCCLAEAKGSSQISSLNSETPQPVFSAVDISEKHEPESQSEYDDFRVKEVLNPNSSVPNEYDDRSLLSLSSASQIHYQKQKHDEALGKIARRSTEDCCNEDVPKARPNFLQRLFVHCRN